MIGDGPQVSKSGDTFSVVLLIGAAALAVAVKGHLKTPYDAIYAEAGEQYNVNSNLLRAIGQTESGHRATAVNVNTNGTRDIGVMQINEKTAGAIGMDLKTLTDPRVNIPTAARILNLMKNELGASYSYHNIISAYNAGTPKVRAKGIGNWPYVLQVSGHHQLYELGRMFA